MHSVQGCTDITGVAKGNHNVTPYILVTGDVVEAKQTFLVIDKTLVSEVPLNSICLDGSFFSFNIIM